jgi:hypothetical protein
MVKLSAIMFAVAGSISKATFHFDFEIIVVTDRTRKGSAHQKRWRGRWQGANPQ